MKYSNLIKTLKKHEGFKATVYKCPAGKLTIGYGRNLENKGITKFEADFLLKNDIMEIEKKLKNLLGKVFTNLSTKKQEVLINMAYNLGVNGLMQFKKFLVALKNKNYDLAAAEMLNSKWAKQVKNRAVFLANIISE